MINKFFIFVLNINLIEQMAKQKILDGISIIRKQRGITQKEISEKLNISQSMYSQLEKGKEEISLDRLESILEAMNCDIMELLQICVTKNEIDDIINLQKNIILKLEELKQKSM
jgi:transcriptional regulator with XRE-family HTH domain